MKRKSQKIPPTQKIFELQTNQSIYMEIFYWNLKKYKNQQISEISWMALIQILEIEEKFLE